MENEEKQKELFVATLLHDLKNPLIAQINSLTQYDKNKCKYVTMNFFPNILLEAFLWSVKY